MRSLLPLSLAAALLAPAPALAQSSPRGGRTYVVREGDTLSEIAQRFHVTADAIGEANRIRRGRIRPGERLRIPSPESAARRSVPAFQYRVRAGDRLTSIARRLHVTVEDLRDANQLRSDELRPGEQLWVPRRGHSGAEIHERLRTGNPVVAADVEPELEAAEADLVRARVETLGLGTVAVGHQLLSEQADPRWIEAAGDPESVDGTLLQPVTEGHFLRGWGSGSEGYHLAIDIGAGIGTPIHAAERGLVAYVGQGIRGYGNLVILVHPNGWITAYAHNHQNRVVPGQLVARGEVLATVGETGFARGPHLHFFFVHQGRHCDPMPLFRPRLERPASQEDGLELVWDAELRPSGIRCLFRSEAPHPHREWFYERERLGRDRGR